MATYPLDLARGRITGKLAGPGGKKHYKGIANTVIVTAREEGVRALYKGITPTVLGAMPYEGFKFGTVAILERMFPKKKDTVEGGTIANNVTRKVMFGGAGGVVAGIMTYPNDTVRRLLQLQGSKGTTEQYAGYL
jgi:solute carrier family 25 phosphate transporter 23/24/25/41